MRYFVVLAPRANLEPVSGLGRGLPVPVHDPAADPVMQCGIAPGSESETRPAPSLWPGPAMVRF